MKNKKCAVFILLGQSNAVGHGVPMKKEDIVSVPMQNVFGLSREKNQSYDGAVLCFEGYVTAGMNLAEEQDDTYSVANCLAKTWQAEINRGAALPDLYIIHIAIGAQGVTSTYMWYPEREPILKPGKLGVVDISLYPFTEHILSLLDGYFKEAGKEYEVMGLHFRGGENDTTVEKEVLEKELFDIYTRIFDGFEKRLGKYPLVLHKIVCPDRCMDMDPTGVKLERMHYINSVFLRLAEKYGGEIFDATKAPQFIPNVRGNGIFIGDCVHYTPEVNGWVAETILAEYKKKNSV
jgi:hypothetical protein